MRAELEALRGESPRIVAIRAQVGQLLARQAGARRLPPNFLARACADYGLAARTVTRDARELLVRYRWPGNVRELANALERVALLSTTDEITAGMLDFLGANGGEGAEASAPTMPGSMDDALRGHVEAALKANDGNIRRTAAALGISRNTLRARMDRYGLRDREAAPRVPTQTPRAPQGSVPAILITEEDDRLLNVGLLLALLPLSRSSRRLTA